MLLFNQAAETLFEGHPGLGLGKRLDALLPITSLGDALGQLPDDGAPREILVPCDERWLHVVMRRVPHSHNETLLTLTDTTAAWSSEMGARADLAEMLPPLRRHTASLTSAADTARGCLGLAILHRRAEPGGSVEIEGGIGAEVVALPFAGL